MVEDFETGDLTNFGWMTLGNEPWTITDSEVYEGVFSAVSGDISDQQTSVLYLDMEVLNDDSISFYRKVSCEDDPNGTNYDWLGFYIDNQEMDRWDGEVDWSQVTYPVTPGTHSFKWVYSKDYSVSSGYDAAWIDFIIFPGVTQSVSVDEISTWKNNTLTVYPNPASLKTTIFLELRDETHVSLQVMDMTGRPVLEPQANQKLPPGSHSIELDVQSLPAGIYVIVVETNQGTQISKIIKK
jgi:hypothetical protein